MIQFTRILTEVIDNQFPNRRFYRFQSFDRGFGQLNLNPHDIPDNAIVECGFYKKVSPEKTPWGMPLGVKWVHTKNLTGKQIKSKIKHSLKVYTQ